MNKKYRCGWWTWELLLVTEMDEGEDGYTFEEILERYYPIKARLYCKDTKDIERAIKVYNKNNKHIKYNRNGIYVERI